MNVDTPMSTLNRAWLLHSTWVFLFVGECENFSKEMRMISLSEEVTRRPDGGSTKILKADRVKSRQPRYISDNVSSGTLDRGSEKGGQTETW